MIDQSLSTGNQNFFYSSRRRKKWKIPSRRAKLQKDAKELSFYKKKQTVLHETWNANQ